MKLKEIESNEGLFEVDVHAAELARVWNPLVPHFNSRLTLMIVVRAVTVEVLSAYQQSLKATKCAALNRLFGKRYTTAGGAKYMSFAEFLRALALSRSVPLQVGRSKSGGLCLIPHQAVIMATFRSEDYPDVELIKAGEAQGPRLNLKLLREFYADMGEESPFPPEAGDAVPQTEATKSSQSSEEYTYYEVPEFPAFLGKPE